MSTIAGLPSIANVAPEASTLQAAASASTAPPPAPTPTAADFRLVIEEDENQGGFVYKTIDRRTGEVVQQLPRADVLKLRDEAGYAAGTVYDAEY